ncbi:MAG: M48 family metallopeptidase, partial [Candidatus Hydrogenedentales bacterium]
VYAIYTFLRVFPRRWWLVLGLGSIPFLIVFIFVMPIWIEPLYNDFRPMQDEAFEAEILALADRAGIENSRVFVVEKSEDTKTVNAYVTGFGDTKRIVMWDTLLERLNEDQALFVLGHEMGHFVLGHIYLRIVFLSSLLIVTLYLVHRASKGLINRFKGRFGFDRLDDVASFPLIVLLMNAFFLVAMPLVLGFARYQEREADRFGLELTRLNYEASTGFLELMDTNLLIPRPGPLFTLWRGTHPSMGARIDFFNAYRPWETGETLQYERYFQH